MHVRALTVGTRSHQPDDDTGQKSEKHGPDEREATLAFEVAYAMPGHALPGDPSSTYGANEAAEQRDQKGQSPGHGPPKIGTIHLRPSRR